MGQEADLFSDIFQNPPILVLSSRITVGDKKAPILCCWINYNQGIGVNLGRGVGQNKTWKGNCPFWHLQSDVLSYCLDIKSRSAGRSHPPPDVCTEKHTFSIKCQGHPQGALAELCGEVVQHLPTYVWPCALSLLPLWSEAHLSAIFLSQKNKESLLDVLIFLNQFQTTHNIFAEFQLWHPTEFILFRYSIKGNSPSIDMNIYCCTAELFSHSPLGPFLCYFFLFSPLSGLAFPLIWSASLLDSSNPSLLLPQNHHSQSKASQEIGKFVLQNIVFPFMYLSSPQLTIALYPMELGIFQYLGFPIYIKRLILFICKLKKIIPSSRELLQGLKSMSA